jgi:hypothetical protein
VNPGTTSAYSPFTPARRPGGRPDIRPSYRVLIHHDYSTLWDALIDRVGLSNAQRAWDHLATQPGSPPLIGQCTKLRGMQKYAKDGWSIWEATDGQANLRSWRGIQGPAFPASQATT